MGKVKHKFKIMENIGYLAAIMAIVIAFSFSTGRTDYCEGWESGYCQGWKDVKGQFSICPIAPVCPIATMDCSNGYKCGYNRGFKAGMKAARK